MGSMMPFRFRKIIKITKFFHINISKNGLSFSLGSRGLTLNFGRKIKRITISLLNTGISYQFFLRNVNTVVFLFLIIIIFTIYFFKAM